MQRLLAAAVALALMAPAALAEPPVATLTVTGQGTAAAAPDLATVRAGIETEGVTAAEALAANNAIAARVIAALKEAGIEARDIQTSGLRVDPRYENPAPDQPQRAPSIAGYGVVNEVAVTVRALDGLGAVLDRLVSEGANRINSLGFGLADDRAMTDEARKAAVADATRAAEVLTGAAGVKLMRVLSVTDGGSFGPQPMPAGMQFRMAAEAVPVEAGEISVQASVTVVWEIAPAQ